MASNKTTVPKPTVHKSFDPETDLVDLQGKVIIVTGANKGLGFATVRQLLIAKATKVYLAARDEGRAMEAIKLLHDEGLGKEGSGSEVLWHELDLSDPEKAKTSAEAFMEKEDRLDTLINNAGGLASLEIGKAGVNFQHWVKQVQPTTFAVHSLISFISYLGPYIFTKALLPLLKRTSQYPGSDVRIINVSSDAHALVPTGVRFKTPEDFNVAYSYRFWPTLIRYGNAKLALNLWSRKLQEELLPSESLPEGITVIAMNPGRVDTHSVRAPRAFRPLAHFLLTRYLGFVEPDVGTHTTLFAAASKQVLEERERYQAGWGAYLAEHPVPGSVKEPSVDNRDDRLKEELFETTETILKDLELSFAIALEM